jgi:hypothetical protein
MSMWKETLKYINSYEAGDHIRRKDLIRFLKPRSESTLDLYIRGLNHIGVLQCFKMGEYTLIKKLKEETPFSLIREITYSPEKWKKWFITEIYKEQK